MCPRAIDAKLYPLHRAMFSDASPAPVKYALSRVHDWLNDSVRLPLIAASAESRKAVDAFHEGAVKAGGKDNGEPGLRKDYGDNYYAAFVIDPDGYRLEAYCGRAK